MQISRIGWIFFNLKEQNIRNFHRSDKHVVFGVVLWILWKTRNNKIFQNLKPFVLDILA